MSRPIYTVGLLGVAIGTVWEQEPGLFQRGEAPTFYFACDTCGACSPLTTNRNTAIGAARGHIHIAHNQEVPHADHHPALGRPAAEQAAPDEEGQDRR